MILYELGLVELAGVEECILPSTILCLEATEELAELTSEHLLAHGMIPLAQATVHRISGAGLGFQGVVGEVEDLGAIHLVVSVVETSSDGFEED